MPQVKAFLCVFLCSVLVFGVSSEQTHHTVEHRNNQRAPSGGSALDPNKPFMALWRKHGNDAVNYQYNLHKPVENGQVNQHGSVTLFKPAHKANQPDRSGFLISYRMSEDFDSNEPIHNSNNNNNNNNNNNGKDNNNNNHNNNRDGKDNLDGMFQGALRGQPLGGHSFVPASPPRWQQQQLQQGRHHYRNPYSKDKPRCYETNNYNQVLCCMPTYSADYPRCWNRNIGWEESFI